jgi:hypothetical protein
LRCNVQSRCRDAPAALPLLHRERSVCTFSLAWHWHRLWMPPCPSWYPVSAREFGLEVISKVTQICQIHSITTK